MEQNRNEKEGERGDLRENPSASGIAHIAHCLPEYFFPRFEVEKKRGNDKGDNVKRAIFFVKCLEFVNRGLHPCHHCPNPFQGKLVSSKDTGIVDVWEVLGIASGFSASLSKRVFDESELYSRVGGRGGAVVRLLTSHLGEPVSIPNGAAFGLSKVEIMPDNDAGQWVFSGISHYLPPLHSRAAPYLPRFILVGSQEPIVESCPKFLRTTPCIEE
ncbi:hypothetical protein PR048_009794 [Dryococelus australis]|uniref:Uncharacterized protein n=1 Tax=Dryococelus australis TaxID=614101 RepID=A0ABQ9I1P0_9NEOP|nr:hypothetical protein PR048_009794 [Dryococelus australis]